MTSELPFMSVYVDDALAEAAALDAAERGAYWSLVFSCWREGGSLPLDARRLSRLAGMELASWPPMWAVLARYFDIEGQVIRHPRVTREMERARGMQQARRKGAEKTNAKRGAKRSLSDTPSARSSGRSGVGILDLDLDLDPDPSPDPAPRGADSSEPAEPASEPASPPVIVFETVGKGPRQHVVTQAWIEEHRAAFPAVDVESAVRRAHAWVQANPTKRKTAGRMPAFLVSWLSRDQNAARSAPPSSAAVGSPTLRSGKNYSDGWEAFSGGKPPPGNDLAGSGPERSDRRDG